LPERQTAIEALMLCSSGGDPMLARKGPMTVWVDVGTAKQVGDRDHLKVFSSEGAAEKWFAENDPEGVAFEYEVLE
jgi:hypothetical protein